ncbi:YmfQ family protein [Vibrio sp. LaRot3]|uniref:YmfQ family protein n=1 Tax=Vibrio sp. LaRot3 TaxID=2998829 RepID=UPI0022CE0792|nr:putative phage tail protein [Vibrio sp. LaRot3]MDA0148864.1 DUF2313 domain-containing protein [Vibrio sp. LaRot3]
MGRLTAQNTEAWLEVLQLLMPQGLAWPKGNDAELTKLLRALAKALADTDSQCDAIEIEMTPSQANILLPEYEAYLGLPECEGQLGDIQSRRHAVETKDKMQGGLATWQIEQLAATLGYKVKVEHILPHHCLRACTHPIWVDSWRHKLKVTVFDMPNVHMTCLDNVMTPLINSDARVLECTLNKYKMGGKYYDFHYAEGL